MADIAALGISVSSNGISEASKGLNDLAGSADKAEKSSGAAARAATTMATGVGATKGASEAASVAVSRLATSQNNLVAGANGATTSLARMTAAANQNSAAMSSLGSSSSRSSTGLRMASLQLSQVAQQTQVTGNFIQALAIQLPDLALGFGPIGIGLGIAAGAALQFFGAIISGGEDSAKTLADQTKLIQATAEAWSEAVPALRDYVDQLERAADVGNLQKVTSDQTVKGVKDISAALSDFVSQNSLISDLMQKAALSPMSPLHDLGIAYRDLRQSITDAANAAAEYQSKAKDGTATFRDLEAAQQAASNVLTSFKDVQAAATEAAARTGSANVTTFANSFDSVVGKITGALAVLSQFQNQAGSALNTAASLQSQLQNTIQNAANPSNFYDRSVPNNAVRGDDGRFIGVPTPGARPSQESFAVPKVKAASTKQDEYASALRSTNDRTKALQAETAAQGALNPLISDYGYALAKAKTSSELMAAAEKQKVAITPQVIAQIDQTSSALARATAEQNKQTEAIQKSRQYVDFLKSTTAGFVNDLRQGLRNGEGFWKSFGSAALNVFDRITDRLLNQVLDAIFKVGDAAGGLGGSGGIFGGILKLFGLGGASQMSIASSGGIGMYASGTNSAPSGLAVVGEKGPELVRFRGGEQVIPNHRLQSAANQNSRGSDGNGGGTVHVDASTTISAPGADAAALAQLRADMAKRDAELPAKVVTYVKEAQKRRMLN